MTDPQEYGAGLSIWDQLRLVQEWSPLLGFLQRLVAETDQFKQGLIIADGLEWLASKSQTKVDDEAVRLISEAVRTPQGEALIRWVISKVEGRT